MGEILLESNLTISSKVECTYTISSLCICQRSLNQITKESVMVNFMCQLYWATGCSDIWSDIIVCVGEDVLV